MCLDWLGFSWLRLMPKSWIYNTIGKSRLNKTPHARDSQAAVLGNSERLRLPRVQLVLMFICVALFSVLAAFVATALSAFAEPQTVRWYAIFVFPGWFTFELFSRYQQNTSARNGELEFWIIFAGNFAYYFGLIFASIFWADRRWRRKRAARIDICQTPEHFA